MSPEFTWRVAREAWLLVGLLGVLAAASWSAGLDWIAAAAVVVAVAIMAFFRDPDRVVPRDPALVLAPADGRVIAVSASPSEREIMIGIFLSIFNVHINRTPVSGEVIEVERTRGGFRAAFRGESSEENERVSVTIRTDWGNVVCTQVAGFVARRIVCRLKPGQRVTAGQRYGLIQFGSRVDLALPAGAEILIARGDRTRAGMTPVVRLNRISA